MARSRKRMLWTGILASVVLIAAFALGTHGYLRWRLHRYKAQLIANGEKLKIAELLPPPREHGSAQTVFIAMNQISTRKHPVITSSPLGKYTLAPGRAVACGALTNFPNAGKETNTWEALGAELEALAPQLKELRAALEDPARHFTINYEQAFSTMLPHLTPLRNACRTLAVAHLYELHRHRLEAALTNLQACLTLAECAADERLIISQLVRIACAGIATAPTWETLQQNQWTDAQLADLQHRWQRLEFLAPMVQSLGMERAKVLELIETMRISDSAFPNSLAVPGNSSFSLFPRNSDDFFDWMDEFGKNLARGIEIVFFRSLWQWYWSYQDELMALQLMQVILHTTHETHTNPSWSTTDRKIGFEIHRLNYISPHSEEGIMIDGPSWADRFFFTQNALTQSRALKKAFQAETMRELAVAAIALKRYQLRHGRPAPALSALTPEFVSEPPRDFMNGQPLQYRLNADGTWVLYSVGDNGQDDGGNATPTESGSKNWLTGLDWVWPQPATAEEAEAFFQAQAERYRRK